MDPQLERLFDATTRPYADAGHYAWHFARGKLRHDPVFFSLLRRGDLPDGGDLLDLGCGQGILLSLLKAAKEEYRAGRWPRGWPAPPLSLRLRGIELSERRVRAARCALGGAVQVVQGNLRYLELPQASVITILDVLFYLQEQDQRRLLHKAAAALEPGGILLVRETDASGGFRFAVSRWGERFAAALRGEFLQPVYYRSAAEWTAELAACGFSVELVPTGAGTPLSHVLFVAKKDLNSSRQAASTVAPE